MASLNHNINHLFITLFIFCTFFSCYSSLNDTITSSKSLKDQQTITSNNTNFKLGFFSPINSTNRYLGIWYINETNNIWIANRDQPLKDSNGIVSIHKDGNLVILNNQNGIIIWTTNISNTSTNSTAQLNNLGNLILRDISGTTIWDSFSHPADAAVPTMRISTNKITGKKIAFAARKSDNDPSSGPFSASIERLGTPEVFIWHDKNIHWRTGPWNGRVFLGSPRMLTLYLSGWRLVPDDDETYLTYDFNDKTMFAILSLTPHGKLKLFEYKNKKVTVNITVGQNECDLYGEFSYVTFKPSLNLETEDFVKVKSYTNSTKYPVAEILKSEMFHDTNSPKVINFSSRGPNHLVPEIMKPDISAPGVNILAAYSPLGLSSLDVDDKRKFKYNLMFGTSMACPHVAGVVAYVRSFHPDWSPAAIKSAIMTAAKPVKGTYDDLAGKFAYGSGNINPKQAIHPGLVYDITKDDYVQMLCNYGYDADKITQISGDNSSCHGAPQRSLLKDINYPSMVIPVASHNKDFPAKIHRIVTNVGFSNSTYKAGYSHPSKSENQDRSSTKTSQIQIIT